MKLAEQSVCIAGAGSTHTPGIIQSLLQKREDFPLRRLTLFDIDEDRLRVVADIMGQFIRDTYPDLEVVVSTDPEKTFSDVDFVFAQIRQGGLSMRSDDEKVPLRHGCVGQETCGAGGSISYGIRSIPGVFGIVRYMKKYSPDAWMLNYSNPAAVVAEATRREFGNDHILNICDMPTAILLSYSKMLGLPSWRDLDPRYFGLNHFGWFTNVYDKTGKDRLPELRQMILEKGMAVSDKHHKDPDWMHTWEVYRRIVRDFPEYLPNSYLEYYLYSKEMVESSDPTSTRADHVINGREKWQKEEHKRYLSDPAGYRSPIQTFTVFGDFIVDAAASIAYNKAERYLVIVENNGAIPNLPADAMVEVPAYVRSWGPEPVSRGPIGTFYKGLIEQQVASEKLAVDAYYEHSYQKALEAIAINKTIPSSSVAREILDDLITSNGEFWPSLS